MLTFLLENIIFNPSQMPLSWQREQKLYGETLSQLLQSYFVPQGTIKTRKGQFLTSDSQLREKRNSLPIQNSPCVNGAKYCVCVLNNKLARSCQGFQLW